MKKFSKFMIVFALVSFVLLGVLVSCPEPEEPEVYDFAAWQADYLDYLIAEVAAKDGLLEEELGDGVEVYDLESDTDKTASDLYDVLDGIFKKDGSLKDGIDALENGLELVAVEGTKLTASTFAAKLEEALEAKLVAAGFVDSSGDYDGDADIDEELSISVTVTVGFMDATKDIVLKYLVVDTTED